MQFLTGPCEPGGGQLHPSVPRPVRSRSPRRRAEQPDAGCWRRRWASSSGPPAGA